MKLNLLALCLPLTLTGLAACGSADDDSETTAQKTKTADEQTAAEKKAAEEKAEDETKSGTNSAATDADKICEQMCAANAEVACPNDLTGKDCLDDCMGEMVDTCIEPLGAFVACVVKDAKGNLECDDEGESDVKDGMCEKEQEAVLACVVGGAGEPSDDCEAACADENFLALTKCVIGDEALCSLVCAGTKAQFGDCGDEGLTATMCALGNPWECTDNAPGDLDFTGCEGEATALSDCSGQ